MHSVFKIFFHAEGTKPWLVLTCLVLAGFFQAVGVGSLLPIAGQLAGDVSRETVVHTILNRFSGFLGLSPSLGTSLFLVAFFLVLRSLFLFGAISYSSIAGTQVAFHLRKRLVAAVFKARWSYYGDQSTGKLANAVSADAMAAGQAYLFSAEVVAYAIQIVAYIALASIINWRVAVAGIVCGGIITLISKNFIMFAKRAGLRGRDRVAQLTSDMVDMFQNFKPLKAMNRFDAEIEDLSEHLKKIRKQHGRVYLAQHGASYGNEAIIACMVASGAYFANRYAGIAFAELTVLGLIFFQVVTYISKLLKFTQQTVVFEASHARLLETIIAAEKEQEQFNGTKPPVVGRGCRLSSVSFAHGAKNVLQDVSIDIPAKKITILQGPSGAGKTTIVDLLLGLQQPQTGQVMIGEASIQDVDVAAWRSKIGYVPQELVLLHGSVRQNITLSDPKITDEQVWEALRKSDAADFVRMMPGALDAVVGELGSKISGGQRQRISLARALVHDPEVLILDEVTSALDPESEEEIINNVALLAGTYTIVAITHRPAWSRIADNIYEIRHGRSRPLKVFRQKRKARA